MSEALQDALDRAKKELGRADHLFFVSLKYTRTVDVLKSLISRLISTFNCCCHALLIKAKEDGLIEDVPELPRLMIDRIKQVYPDPELSNYLDLYLLLRKIDNADFERAKEFRRHVTMIAFVDDKKIEVTIDIVFDYYTKTKEFLNYVHDFLEGKNED